MALIPGHPTVDFLRPDIHPPQGEPVAPLFPGWHAVPEPSPPLALLGCRDAINLTSMGDGKRGSKPGSLGHSFWIQLGGSNLVNVHLH